MITLLANSDWTMEKTEVAKKRKAQKEEMTPHFATLIDQVNDDLSKTEQQFVKRIEGIQDLREKLNDDILQINQRIA